ncbi:M12 family metallopeptidase [Paraburkholderia sp. OAS925]|uniref:M12 family metallopeptidase n=1 Tax=Paraburkholderia sp. OAS925 TaxID=2663827 RepID=UPI003672C4AA
MYRLGFIAPMILALMPIFPKPALAHGIDAGQPPDIQTPRPRIPQPAAGGAFDPHAVEGVVDQFRLWTTGSTLAGCFIGGPSEIQKFFVDSIQEIVIYANLKIDFGKPDAYNKCDGTPYHIRVSFDHTLGNWSYVGTDSTKIAYDSPSMNIAYATSAPFPSVDKIRLKGVILHETGHALGLQHEHQSPKANCEAEFDWPKIYSTFSKDYGWDQKKVDDNLRALISSPRLRTTPYDRSSIMNYYFAAWMFKNGSLSPCSSNENFVLSSVDKQTIAETYPKTAQEQVALINRYGEQSKPILQKLLTTDQQKQWSQDLIGSAAQTAAPGYKIDLTSTNITVCKDVSGVTINAGSNSNVTTCIGSSKDINVGAPGK